MSKTTTLTIGTRRSRLALAQSELVRSALCAAHPGLVVAFKTVITKGDQSQTQDIPLPAAGLKGLWTYEMEEMLERGEIDLAVHSLKDVPTIMRSVFCLGAYPTRASRRDVVVSRTGASLQELAAGSVVGTSSYRRMAQVLRLRPDLEVRVIRGNIDTRLAKVRDVAGPFDAIVLAEAGLQRIGLAGEITQVLSEEEMLPAGAQGALGVQCLAERGDVRELLTAIHDPSAAAELIAERAFLDRLGSTCNAAVAVSAHTVGKQLQMQGLCLNKEGSSAVHVSTTGDASRAAALGIALADDALHRGAGSLLVAVL